MLTISRRTSRHSATDSWTGRASAAGNAGETWGYNNRISIGANYIFAPTLLMDAFWGWTRQNTNVEQPGIGENYGLDVLGLPGNEWTRAVPERLAAVRRQRLCGLRHRRAVHAVLPERQPVFLPIELHEHPRKARDSLGHRHQLRADEPHAAGVSGRRVDGRAGAVHRSEPDPPPRVWCRTTGEAARRPA